MKSQTIFDIFNREYIKINRKKGDKFSVTGIDYDKLENNEKKSIANSEPLNFLFSPNSFLYKFEEEKIDEDQDEKSDASKGFSKEFSELLRIVSFSYSYCRSILGDLSFIGPLREYPRNYYELTGDEKTTVGARGENMASLLHRNYEKIKEELDNWICKFSFGERVSLDNLNENLVSIEFEENNEKRNITNIGFGASQILPLIVQALVSPKGSLTIAEQPEIHLNPKLQSVLADLFAYMANNDKRIIVETHSEHLLLRLRRLVADKTLDASNLAVYFVEKENKKSAIREINIQDNGHIQPNDWPRGFFEDGFKEALELAREQSKRR